MVQKQTRTLTVTTPSDREIVMTRVFDAPRELVFEAHSKCEHLEKWWGPRGFTLSVCEMDFRPGGAYRFVSRGLASLIRGPGKIVDANLETGRVEDGPKIVDGTPK